MTKNVLIFGFIMGIIISIHMVSTAHVCYISENFKGSAVIGYGAMIAVFSFIFVGVRNYRNKIGNGAISFGKALKLGVLMALLASTVYVVVWLVYYYLFIPDFLDKYISHVLKNTADTGATQAELTEKAADMQEFKEMYKNPLFVVLATYAEIFPVGFIVSLISALILKKKLPAQNTEAS